MIVVGDYVLATKYNDGDPGDHWAVGFFDGLAHPDYDPPRYKVVDVLGVQFRHNGFRRVEAISKEVGRRLLAVGAQIELGDASVWEWAEDMKRAK